MNKNKILVIIICIIGIPIINYIFLKNIDLYFLSVINLGFGLIISKIWSHL